MLAQARICSLCSRPDYYNSGCRIRPDVAPRALLLVAARLFPSGTDLFRGGRAHAGPSSNSDPERDRRNKSNRLTPAALGKNDPGLLGKMSPPQSQDLAHDSAQHESWSAVPMPRVTLHCGSFRNAVLAHEGAKMRRPDGRRARESGRFVAHVMNHVEHRPRAATAGSTLIVAGRARAQSRCGYAARRGTLLTSTFREACHAS